MKKKVLLPLARWERTKPVLSEVEGVKVNILQLCIILCLIDLSFSLNFRQIAYIPDGQCDCFGFIRAFDTDHNGLNELIFFTEETSGVFYIIDYEYRPMNKYVAVDTLMRPTYLPWDVGYIDDDSLCDLVIQGSKPDSLQVYESPAYNSYPDSLVWKDKFSGIAIAPSYITDLDRDGKKEILTADIDVNIIYIFENTANNQYILVYTDSFVNYIDGDNGPFAIGDFDQDGLMEFVTAGTEGEVVLWECTGDNQYQVIWTDAVPTKNVYDNISANDMDQDGRPEFIIKGFHGVVNGTWTGHWTFYEAAGNNTYEPIYVDSITNIMTWPNWHSASYCGDVDGDGIDEAVLAVSNNWTIYKATGNNTFERIFTAYPPGGNGRANTSICVYDLNQNGYDEIIESGSWSSVSSATMIWEIEAVRLLYPNGGEVFESATQETIRW